MKDKLSGKIKKEFLALREKTYSCLIDDASEVKSQSHKKACHKKT